MNEGDDSGKGKTSRRPRLVASRRNLRRKEVSTHRPTVAEIAERARELMEEMDIADDEGARARAVFNFHAKTTVEIGGGHPAQAADSPAGEKRDSATETIRKAIGDEMISGLELNFYGETAVKIAGR